MNKSRREADDTMVQLAEEKRNTEYIAQESEIELEKVRLDACVSTRVKSQSLTRLTFCLLVNFRFLPHLWIMNILTVLYNIVGNRMGDGKNITAFYHVAVNLWIAAVECCVVLCCKFVHSMIRIVKKIYKLYIYCIINLIIVAFPSNTMLKQSIHEDFFH